MKFVECNNTPNIYVVLDDIDFEERINNMSKTNKIDCELLKQKVFSIVSDFYEKILDIDVI